MITASINPAPCMMNTLHANTQFANTQFQRSNEQLAQRSLTGEIHCGSE